MFTEMTLRQKRDVVRVVLCRADAWLDWEDHPIDAPIRSAGRIFSTIRGMFRRTTLQPPRTGQLAPEVPRQAPPPVPAPERPREPALNRAILAFAVLKRHDLVRPMVTGEKYLPMGTPAPALVRPWRAMVVFAVAVAVVGAVIEVL